MKIFITLLLLLSINFSVKADNYKNKFGPNIGYIVDSKGYFDNYKFGISVIKTNRKENKNSDSIFSLYTIPEVNIIFDNNKLNQLSIPINFGIRLLRTFRFGLGFDIRSNLVFDGPNRKGMNQLEYRINNSYINPIAVFGIDFGVLSLDFKAMRYINGVYYSNSIIFYF
jgi:hypothetical protein